MRIGDGNIHDCAFKAGSMPARPDRGQETVQKSRQGRRRCITRRATTAQLAGFFVCGFVGGFCCTGHVRIGTGK